MRWSFVTLAIVLGYGAWCGACSRTALFEDECRGDTCESQVADTQIETPDTQTSKEHSDGPTVDDPSALDTLSPTDSWTDSATGTQSSNETETETASVTQTETETASATQTETETGTISDSDTQPVCEADEDLGALAIGQARTTVLEVQAADNDHPGGCGNGAEVVVRFELTQRAEIDVDVLQFGDHLLGLYRDLGGSCTQWPLACFDPAGQRASSTVWADLEPGVYFAVVEGRDADLADTLVLTLTMRTSACGNGDLDPAEECDDGNLEPDDGCGPACLVESGECLVDEAFGVLPPSLQVERSLDMTLLRDEWATECAPYGYDYVFSFTTQRTADIIVNYSQEGTHAVGLYTGGQVEQFLCQASDGVCLAREPGQSGTVTFRGREPGTYYLIGESVGYEEAGTLNLALRISGCTPAEDLGALVKSQAVVRSSATTAGTGIFAAGCGGASGNEVVYAFSLGEAGGLDLAWQQSTDHVLGLFRETGEDCDAEQIDCHDPGGAATGSTSFARLEAGEYLLIVDAYAPGDEGPFQVTLTAR